MSKSVFCNKCGECLDNLPVFSLGEEILCSNCSSVAPRLVVVEDTLGLSDYVVSLAKSEGKTIRFRESDREGRITSADQNDDGSLSYSISGSSPQGEEDTPVVCQVLVTKLNTLGANWTNPVPGKRGVGGERGVDCEAVANDFPEQKLSIQVVRAIVDQNLWKQLNHQKRFESLNISKEQIVAQIKQAIEQKANDRKIPPTVRQSLTLALDATRLPVLGFEDIREEFQAKFGPWVKSIGFEAVWLVGPLDSLTWRLDL